ncbi:aldose 1-epimerase [Pseudomonas sp. BP8]|uniref:aldose 1-epimerase n=1 Tax=Pseudomonas sp. BP8 TaxID=2817864 RepID=UPI001AE9AEFC|nr:aldose 1-epimerase [Pseudomonas sp. BP8]MBP2263887.1 aldose 1-epimerase [Pseudomonas sp. BP8]HDS1736683.1 aldose 1-epimerase [Pseudomonas putida]
MSPHEVHLEDRLTRLSLAPSVGGSLVNWQVKKTGQPLLRHSDAAALASGSPRRLGCYPLAPWSNRIAEGGFERPDGWLALPPNTDNSPYAIHGSAWQQPWRVSHQGSDHACLTLESRLPFAYRATLHVSLDEGCLSLDLQVTHLDLRPTWHGLGLHPYFPRHDDTQLLAPARQVWLGEADTLPSRQEEIPEDWRFETLSALPQRVVDHAFSGWQGACTIVQPSAGYQLQCSASGTDHYLLFCPQDQGFFCFEPVSHPINAHHLPGRPGLRLLSQGEHVSLGFRMAYQPLSR